MSEVRRIMLTRLKEILNRFKGTPARKTLGVPVDARRIPNTIFLPKGFKAERQFGSEGRGNQILHFNIINPKTKRSSGVMELQWDSLNGLYRPLDNPGVNLYPEAQGQGLYPAFLKEVNRFVDIGSASTTTHGTTENAQKVWKKMGASAEDVLGDLASPQAYVLRRKK